MVIVFITTFNNISVISWWSVLLVEEISVLGENHRPSASPNIPGTIKVKIVKPDIELQVILKRRGVLDFTITAQLSRYGDKVKTMFLFFHSMSIRNAPVV
jgi:hypothetical protein